MAVPEARITVRRRRIQNALWPIVFIVIGLGWKYPLLGFVVPIVMITGIAGSFSHGRYVCGNLCPRGSFFDRLLTHVSLRRHIPSAFRNTWFRVIVLAALMGFMVYRIAQDPASWRHWGRVFWLMCAVTTGIGVVLGIAIHPRAWCSFCPIGTLQSFIGGRKRPLRIDPALCIECRLCERACPFDLPVMSHKPAGIVREPDCLRCSECVAACPKQALSFRE